MRCFKYKYYGVKVVRYVVVLVICYFYKGVECRNEIMDKFFIFGGSYIIYLFRLKNNKRLRKVNV